MTLTWNGHNFWLVHPSWLKFLHFLDEALEQKVWKFELDRMYQSKVMTISSQGQNLGGAQLKKHPVDSLRNRRTKLIFLYRSIWWLSMGNLKGPKFPIDSHRREKLISLDDFSMKLYNVWVYSYLHSKIHLLEGELTIWVIFEFDAPLKMRFFDKIWFYVG